MNFQPKGIIPAMVTPVTSEGKINVEALRKLTNYLIEGGVHGLFPFHGCVFRRDSTTHSGRIRPLIPGASDHPFRGHPTTRSGRIRTLIPA